MKKLILVLIAELVCLLLGMVLMSGCAERSRSLKNCYSDSIQAAQQGDWTNFIAVFSSQTKAEINDIIDKKLKTRQEIMELFVQFYFSLEELECRGIYDEVKENGQPRVQLKVSIGKMFI